MNGAKFKIDDIKEENEKDFEYEMFSKNEKDFESKKDFENEKK